MINPNYAKNQFHPLAYVHPDARIHESVTISPFCHIGAGVEIGAGSFIGPNVTLQSGVLLGENCHVGAGVTMNPETTQLEYWKKDEDIVYANAMHIRIRIGNNVHIDPSTTFHGEITLGNDCWVGSNVTIYDGARIGDRVKIFPSAVISAIPQDLKFDGEKTTLHVGNDTVIRECCTLNRGTNAHGKTEVGANCLLMAYVHVAHDCIVGDHVILANAVNLAGHVEIGDWAILGGLSGCHQFVKIGAHSIIAAGVTVRKDVPPFIKAGREPVQYAGVNSIGLRRRGFEAETINHIHDIYRHIFVSNMNTAKALDHVVTHVPFSDERDMIVNFVRNSERGIVKGI
jgi:UDP-N-acetylglucosamine acyltransferase